MIASAITAPILNSREDDDEGGMIATPIIKLTILNQRKMMTMVTLLALVDK